MWSRTLIACTSRKLIYLNDRMFSFRLKFEFHINLIASIVKLKSSTLPLAIGGSIVFLTLLLTSVASAQGAGTPWTQPYRLSSQAGQVGDQIMFADPFGYVHLIWPETGLMADQTVLYYSRFDGETWTVPTDILLIPPAATISATFDLDGLLHLLFTRGDNGTIYYTKASIQDAISAQAWQKPKPLGLSARQISFKVDSIGVFHLLYSGYEQNAPGIYYIYSDDDGQTWSKPVWLDPDIPPDMAPSQIQLELGEENSLHAAWLYWDQEFMGRWIRYANSFDQGQSWSAPFTIDDSEAGSGELRLPWPSMAVNGNEVHLIWAGDVETHREHRFSSDLGRTWNQAVFVFGDLHGGALGHGLALDTLGRMHFLGQIRWPQGIYHAYWSQGRWSIPNMIYLIAQNDAEEQGERIHAHRVRVAIRTGNQMVVTFTTSPSDPQSILYAMHMTMADVPALDIARLPEQTPAPTIDSGLGSASPMPPTESPTGIPNPDTILDSEAPRENQPSSGLMWGILPVVLLVAGVVIVRYLFRRNG